MQGRFLGEVGLGNIDGARELVAPEAADQVESWSLRLYFPSHSSPATSEDKTKLDRFIGHFYRITQMDHTETEADVHLVFVGTDAIVGFPSVADDPLLPTSAAFMVKLARTVEGEGEDLEYGRWKIITFGSITERR